MYNITGTFTTEQGWYFDIPLLISSQGYSLSHLTHHQILGPFDVRVALDNGLEELQVLNMPGFADTVYKVMNGGL